MKSPSVPCDIKVGYPPLFLSCPVERLHREQLLKIFRSLPGATPPIQARQVSPEVQTRSKRKTRQGANIGHVEADFTSWSVLAQTAATEPKRAESHLSRHRTQWGTRLRAVN